MLNLQSNQQPHAVNPNQVLQLGQTQETALKIPTQHLTGAKIATVFVLVSATLAAGLLAQLPQVGLTATELNKETAAAIATTAAGALVHTKLTSTNADIQAAVKAIMEFATGKLACVAAGNFHKYLANKPA